MGGAMNAPILDGRDAEAVVADLVARASAYVPGWRVGSSGPSAALAGVFGRYLQALIERVNQAPAKHELAFLDQLGLDLLPPQAARAPIVFTPLPNAGDVRVPAASQVGADVEGHDGPLVYETEEDVALAAARLAEVVTLWPGRDAFADHTSDVLGGIPFRLFQPLRPVAHELYLGHAVHLSLSGPATVEVRFELSLTADPPLNLAWEYWDGEVWRGFKDFVPPEGATDRDSLDGTAGLSRSGVVRLVADCATTAPRTVAGVASSWIRARVADPLPPSATRRLPLVDRISLATILASPFGALTVLTEGTGAPGLFVSLEMLAGQGVGVAGSRIEVTDAEGVRRDAVVSGESVMFDGLAPGDYELRVSIVGFPPLETPVSVGEFGLAAWVNATIEGIMPDSAYADALKLDVTKTFYPLGQVPRAGSSFSLSSEEALSKPGASLTLFPTEAETGQDATEDDKDVEVVAEYWDGGSWRSFTIGGQPIPATTVQAFFGGTGFTVDVPADLAERDLAGEPGRWIRMQVRAGAFLAARSIEIGAETVTVTEPRPPALSGVRLGYVYRSPEDPADACITYGDFTWQDHTDDARWRGGSFEPFGPVADRTPTLYLGFDRALPADVIGLFLDAAGQEGVDDGPALRWETWDGTTWLPITVSDETANLARQGLVRAVCPGADPPVSALVLRADGDVLEVADAPQALRFRPGDLVEVAKDGKGELATVASSDDGVIRLRTPLGATYDRANVTLAALPRFGTPRSWIRARLESDGDPLEAELGGVHLNATWASQVQTFVGEPLGSSDGRPGQSLFFRTSPVLAGEVVEVRELDGPRAEVELPILLAELEGHGLSAADVRTVADPRTGLVTEAWVRWQGRPNLFFSGPDDRHYVIERSRGRVQFGDGVLGRIPPTGRDNVRTARYRSGGGLIGNVPAGAIGQILSGVPAQGATNPRAAEGGADGELPDGVFSRGPAMVRHRRQALSLEDVEALAREASPAVAVARALPTTHPTGRPAPGWVKVIVMPHSGDPRPSPSFELRRRIEAFLALRAPAGAARQFRVAAPDYQPIGVEAVVVPVDPSKAGPVVAAATAAIRAFLHPLTGGPQGTGWPFGRDVFASDVASVLESTPGVDVVPNLELLLDGTPRGDRVEVPGDRIVVAGPIRIRAQGSEG
jgi:hypothetical protein